MRQIRLTFFIIATIMGASTVPVNGEGVSFTESISPEQAKRGQSLKDLIGALLSKGQEGHLSAGAGPFIGLSDKCPIRFLSLRKNEPTWKNRYCDLVITVPEKDRAPYPTGFVLIEKRQNDRDVRFIHYRFDLTGRLLNAYEMLGKVDSNGKPVRGSAVDTRLDVTEPTVSKEANELLDFWRLGRYKKFLVKPAAKTEEKTAPGR